MIDAVLLVLIVAIPLSALPMWARDFADLLWMFAARKALTGLTTLIVMAAVVFIAGEFTGLPPNSATGFSVAILATPPIAKWTANAIARWMAQRRLHGDAEALQKLAPLSGFVFAEERMEQANAYEAPRVAQ